MKLRFGYNDQTFGTIEDTPDGLRYAGDVPRLQRLVAEIAGPERPEDAPGGLPGFLRFMARQTNNGYLWCQAVDAPTPDAPTAADAPVPPS